MCLSPVCFADDTQTGQSHSRAAHTDGSVCVGASLGWFPVWAVFFFSVWTYACILVWMCPRCGCRVFESACVSVHRLQDLLCSTHCFFSGTIALHPKESPPSASRIRSSFLGAASGSALAESADFQALLHASQGDVYDGNQAPRGAQRAQQPV